MAQETFRLIKYGTIWGFFKWNEHRKSASRILVPISNTYCTEEKISKGINQNSSSSFIKIVQNIQKYSVGDKPAMAECLNRSFSIFNFNDPIRDNKQRQPPAKSNHWESTREWKLNHSKVFSSL